MIRPIPVTDRGLFIFEGSRKFEFPSRLVPRILALPRYQPCKFELAHRASPGPVGSRPLDCARPISGDEMSEPE
jgi:hypothetical protein